VKKILKAKILQNKKIAEDHFCMDIGAPWLGTNSRPGQFLNIRVRDEATDPLLRIPLGIHRIRKKGVSLLYKVLGPGTEILKSRRKGEMIDVLGPLGNGFDLSVFSRRKNATAVLVSGGHGIAPLFSLAEELRRKKVRVEFFTGAKAGKHIIKTGELNKLGVKVHIATEDGTRGRKGLVTDIVRDYMKRNPNPEAIFACGPKPMTAAVAAIAKEKGIKAQVTYDEYMACGIGACRGCAVETTEGIKLSCKDGPVFDAEIIKWT